MVNLRRISVTEQHNRRLPETIKRLWEDMDSNPVTQTLILAHHTFSHQGIKSLMGLVEVASIPRDQNYEKILRLAIINPTYILSFPNPPSQSTLVQVVF